MVELINHTSSTTSRYTSLYGDTQVLSQQTRSDQEINHKLPLSDNYYPVHVSMHVAMGGYEYWATVAVRPSTFAVSAMRLVALRNGYKIL